MVNYCTTASNNNLQDALASLVYLVNENEQQILQLETKLDFVCAELFAYGEKHIAHDIYKILYTILANGSLVCSLNNNSHGLDRQY